MTGALKQTEADRGRPAVIDAFQAIAAAVDEVGEEKAAVMLAKLALLLSNEVADPAKVASCVERAKADL